MSTKRIINFICWVVLGGVLVSADVYIDSWQFWVVLLLAHIMEETS